MADYGSKTNFMEHLSPNSNIRATDIHTLDQCGRQATLHSKEARRSMQQGVPMPAKSFDQWEREMNAKNWLRKRMTRGGQNFEAGNILETL
jgi:hypothetical protein